MACDRCGGQALARTGSYFDSSIICIPCSAIEKNHPQYEEAHRVENEAVRAGDMNFPGIGVPPGLRLACRQARARREGRLEV